MTNQERIELRVRLSSGAFDTSVELPVKASKKDREAVVCAWFKLIEAALVLAGDTND